MNHLGVVFSDAFGLFFGFWLDFWKNGTKSANLGNFGVLSRSVGIPHNIVSPCQGIAYPRNDAAERKAWTSLGYAEV